MVEQIQWIGDVLAVCMCAVTVVALVFQRAKYRRKLQARDVAGVVTDFNQEFRQFVAPDKVSLKTLPRFEGGESVGSIGHPLSDSTREYGQAQEMGRDAAILSTADRYGEVKRLADAGLDAEEIFERVGLPKAEIELALKVNRLRSDAGENARSGKSFLA